jgi:Holliday junction resolvase RusA-like endonuclease
MTYRLELRGPIVPKARPRGRGKQHYLPDDYREWKEAAIGQLRQQLGPLRLSGIRLNVLLKGKHSRRGDADNIVGAIMDALVQGEILANDNLVAVTALSVELQHSPLPPVALIALEPA